MVEQGPRGVPAGESREGFFGEGQRGAEGKATGAYGTGAACLQGSGGSGTGGAEHHALLSPDFAAALRFGCGAGGESGDAAAAAGFPASRRCAGTTAAGEGLSRKNVWDKAGGMLGAERVGVLQRA